MGIPGYKERVGTTNVIEQPGKEKVDLYGCSSFQKDCNEAKHGKRRCCSQKAYLLSLKDTELSHKSSLLAIKEKSEEELQSQLEQEKSARNKLKKSETLQTTVHLIRFEHNDGYGLASIKTFGG